METALILGIAFSIASVALLAGLALGFIAGRAK